MIKIVCIDDRTPSKTDRYKYLTIGKVYDAEERFDVNCYRITDDEGKNCLYHIKCFKSLAQLREERINQILDDE